MTEYTAHLRLPIPDFLSEPWHNRVEEMIRAVDTAIYEALLAQEVAEWANSTLYAIGDLVISPDDGMIWSCGVAHTSPVSPTTFTTFVTANPTYWEHSVDIPHSRGAWSTGATYTQNDFVIESNRYAVCLISHVAGSSFNTDLGAGKWEILIDLSTLGVGINGNPEASIASAGTVNLASQNATRILITGTTGPITNFGSATNTFKIVRYRDLGVTVGHNPSFIILIGGASRTMNPNDISFFASDSTGVWRELIFSSAAGFPADNTIRGMVALATNAEGITGTDAFKAMTAASTKAAMDARFFPTGTKMLFRQTTAPTGWTKDTTHNDKALRVVSGSIVDGGTVDFSTLFARTSVDNTTLVASQIPPHTHGVSGNTGNDTPDHTHDLNDNTLIVGGTNLQGGSALGNYGTPIGAGVGTGGASVRHQHPIALTTDSGSGGGTAHTHTVDMRVKFVDLIIATKD